MQSTAKLKYLRIAPRKIRLIADLIRNKSAEEAQSILSFSTKKSADPLLRLLRQAIANAKNEFNLKESDLYISKITVDEGPKLKRWRARSRGQAFEIQKKTSHINLVLSEIKGVSIKKTKKKITKKPKAEKVKAEDISGKKPKANIKKKEFRAQKETLKPKAGKSSRKIFRRKAI